MKVFWLRVKQSDFTHGDYQVKSDAEPKHFRNGSSASDSAKKNHLEIFFGKFTVLVAESKSSKASSSKLTTLLK